MEFLQYFNRKKFLAFVPQLRENPSHWGLIEVVLTGKTRHNAAYIAKQLLEHFSGYEGVIFICNSKEILVLANMKREVDIPALSVAINNKMPQYSCTVAASDLTEEGLLRFQFRLNDLDDGGAQAASGSSLLNLRKERAEKIVMVADDDMFMRSLIVKTFAARARIIEADKADNLVDTYLEEMPDVLFLDIHLPGGSGIDVLSQIQGFDDTAYVIMMSSDSVKDNVLEAKKYGAKGFIAKPFTVEKLEASYSKSPSVPLAAIPVPPPPAATEDKKK